MFVSSALSSDEFHRTAEKLIAILIGKWQPVPVERERRTAPSWHVYLAQATVIVPPSASRTANNARVRRTVSPGFGVVVSVSGREHHPVDSVGARSKSISGSSTITGDLQSVVVGFFANLESTRISFLRITFS